MRVKFTSHCWGLPSDIILIPNRRWTTDRARDAVSVYNEE